MPPETIQNAFFQKQLETMPSEDRRSHLENRLRALLIRALERSPAYGELLAQAGIKSPADITGLDDLPRLPMLNLAEISRRQKERPPLGGFETRDVAEFHRLYVNPGFILQPGEQEYRDTTWAEGLVAGGIKKGDVVLNTFSYHLWPYAFMLDESCRRLGAVCVPSGTGNAFMQVRIMSKLGVTAYLGTPSFLMTLLQRAEAMKLDPQRDLKLRSAVVGAEMLPESLRERLQDNLGISVRQAYGTVLLGCLGYECVEGKGLHVPADVLVEVVDPKTGQPVEHGAAGEVVATSFNPDYPMIRLATGDLSQFRREACPCGRTGPMLKRILGRIDQAVKVRGTFVHPWQMDELVNEHPDVFKYQAVITREGERDELTLNVELHQDSEETRPFERALERDLREHLFVKGKVTVLKRGSIPDFHGKIIDRRQWD
jgi:phenylacetate-CoA ligase